jgi:hypothetical protein
MHHSCEDSNEIRRVLLSLALGVVRLSVSGVVRFSIWFSYKPDHFFLFFMNSQSSWRLR